MHSSVRVGRSVLISILLLLPVAACTSAHSGRGGEEEEEDEAKVAWADVPAPVKATLQREGGGASIATVDRESRKGKLVYEADVRIDGKNWEIVVAEDGTLISRKLDPEGSEQPKH